MRPRTLMPIVLGAVASGCASLPDETLRYHLPTWQATIVATRTVACEKDPTTAKPWKNPTLGPATAIVTPTYSSDPKAWANLPIKKLERWYADQDLTVTLTDDGRLKSINTTSTGDGSNVVKSMVSLAATSRGATWLKTLTPNRDDDLCALVRKHAADDSTAVAITFRTRFDRDTSAHPDGFDLYVDEPFDGVEGAFPPLKAKLTIEPMMVSGSESPPAGDHLTIELRQVAKAIVVLGEGTKEIERHEFFVPTTAARYLQVPRAPMFGQTNLELELAGSGAITKVKYGRKSGAADAAGAVEELAKLRSTPASKTEQLKAEADLIAAQARLDKCRKDPENCK